MDGDFDPSEYDKIMQSVFDEQYYDEEDDEKPDFSDNELLDGGKQFLVKILLNSFGKLRQTIMLLASIFCHARSSIYLVSRDNSLIEVRKKNCYNKTSLNQ